jgi:heptosyltransferase I
MKTAGQKYLVIRLSSIGDIVHALPAVSALGETFPGSEITWAVETRYASLLDGNPIVRRLVKLDTLGWRKRPVSPRTLAELVGSIRSLREHVFDAVIDFQGLVKSGFLSRLCRSRMRIGFSRPWLKESAAGFFYTRQVRAERRKHAIEENLALVEALGARCRRWQFPLARSEADDSYAGAALLKLGIRDFILMNPGGGWRAKRWAPSNYADLIRRLEPEISSHFILSGSPGEEDEIGQILRTAGSSRACYLPTTIRQFIELARRAKLFIGGDTGPLHLAAALGIPIVALYGPTDPARNGPFSPADIVLANDEPVNHTRRGKQAHFLSGISVEEVAGAVRRRLGEGA